MLQAWTPLYLNQLAARPSALLTGYLSAVAWAVRWDAHCWDAHCWDAHDHANYKHCYRNENHTKN